MHYPTDINLLFDAVRKVITLTAQLHNEMNLPGWRQNGHNIKKIKKLFNRVRKLKQSGSKNEKRKQQTKELVKEAHQTYIKEVNWFLEKTEKDIKNLNNISLMTTAKIIEIAKYIKHAKRQIEQIERRIIKGESIPHEEKIFSIFEEHTEWISKGKAGVPQELGLKVCIIEDNYGFILHQKVIEKQTDDKVAVSIIRETKEKFPELTGCSFDKGFYTPENREKLFEIVEKVIMPKKGRLSQNDKEIEYSEEFIEGRRKHSAVESGINALEQHGLDRCPDHGIKGFRKYVTLSVLSRNIQIVGNIILRKRVKQENKLKRLKSAPPWDKRIAA